jgi:hypothetical protein
MQRFFVLVFFLGLAGFGLAQQFTTPPVVKPNSFKCDEVTVIFADRNSNCIVNIYYAADKNVGLEKIEMQLLSIRDMIGQIVKENEANLVWSKAEGNLISYSLGTRNAKNQSEYGFNLAFKVRVGNCYQVNSIFGSRTECRSATAYELKAKMIYFFANGLQYKNEIAIRVK